MNDNDEILGRDDGKSKLCNSNPRAITETNMIASS
jgi:hypothetical protein